MGHISPGDPGWTYSRIAGIDPSLTGTGIAGVDGHTLTVRTKRKGDDRLEEIAAVVTTELLWGDRPHLVLIEDLPTHAHGAGLTGMVQGVIRHQLLRAKVPYITVPAATLKKYATGKGNATKPDMRMAMYQRAGLDERDDNRVDAFWLRQIGLYAVGHPDAIAMPKPNREAVLKLAWPQDITARLLHPYEQLVPIEEATA